MFHELAKKVTTEISGVLHDVREQDARALLQSILQKQRIVVAGAGRVGLACKGFAMRLGHLGLSAFTPNDSTIPPIGANDLLVVGSSSGETQTVYDVALNAKRNGASVVAITADADSRIATLADMVIALNAPTKFGTTKGGSSIQPMATLFEQSLQVLFDVVILMLMKEMGCTHEDMWRRHSNVD
jgi:6-phospho-3-hexuloisomerase